MNLESWVGVGWALILLLFYFYKRKWFSRAIVLGIVFLLFVAFGRAFQLSVATYFHWKSNPIGKYLLPPHTPISYFSGYCFFHYFLELLLTLGGALFAYFLFWVFQKKDYVDSTERNLAVFGSMVSGYIYFFFFLLGGFLLAILFKLFQNYRKKEKGTKITSLVLPLLVSLIITIMYNSLR